MLNKSRRDWVDMWLMNEEVEELPVPWNDYDTDHKIAKQHRPFCPPFKHGEVDQLVADYLERGGKITKYPTRKPRKTRTSLTPLADDRIVPKY